MMDKMNSKFEKSFQVIMETFKTGSNFAEIKARAEKVSRDVVKAVKKDDLLADNLGLDNDEDSKNFFNEIYTMIMKGSSRLNQGDIREMAFNLGITAGNTWLNKVNNEKEFYELFSSKLSEEERKKKYGTQSRPKNCSQQIYKNWKAQNPDASFDDFKKYLIRNADSPLDSMNREYALDFKNLIRIYNMNEKDLRKVKVDIKSLDGKNVIDMVHEKIKSLKRN